MDLRLQFSLLPIRDWNIQNLILLNIRSGLQFSLLPIRDWNVIWRKSCNAADYCNFHYSLLGIETQKVDSYIQQIKLQFSLLPIRDWNAIEITTPAGMVIAIFITPY